MDKILKLLIDDFQCHKPSAHYMLLLEKVCCAEHAFLATLTGEQKKQYLALEFICGELSVAEQNEFAEYLFENLK